MLKNATELTAIHNLNELFTGPSWPCLVPCVETDFSLSDGNLILLQNVNVGDLCMKKMEAQ